MLIATYKDNLMNITVDNKCRISCSFVCSTNNTHSKHYRLAVSHVFHVKADFNITCDVCDTFYFTTELLDRF